MSKNVEVLVACMNQDDDKLYEMMNLRTDAVFANQCQHYSFEVYNKNGRTLKMINTSDRGVGKNRNVGILNATGTYLLFADEDMIYEDDYEANIIKAFESLPDADIIIFNLEYLNKIIKGKKREISKIHRLYWYNSMRYGAARIAIKKESLQKSNLWFSLLYGGGAPYSSGEDSLFIREALKKKLTIYAHPDKLAIVKQEESSWFTGFHEKYYRDRGVLIANMFPKLKYLFAFYYAYRLKNTSTTFTIRQIFALIIEGIAEFEEN